MRDLIGKRRARRLPAEPPDRAVGAEVGAARDAVAVAIVGIGALQDFVVGDQIELGAPEQRRGHAGAGAHAVCQSAAFEGVGETRKETSGAFGREARRRVVLQLQTKRRIASAVRRSKTHDSAMDVRASIAVYDPRAAASGVARCAAAGIE